MKNLWFTLFLFLLCPSFAHASFKGRLFVDTNQNSVYDKGEKPVPGVAVSDGLNVVLTDAQGCFELPGHARQKFIFITTPSGYKTYNAHYLPIEEGRECYDFPLYSYTPAITKEGTHSFIQITDTEIFNTKNHEDWVGNLREYAANEKVSFIIHTGDICYENGLKAHIQLMNTRNMECPVFYCIGNHDLVDGQYGEELFESLYGPVFYSFDVGNVHYVVTPMPYGDYKPSYTQDEVVAWLKNDLAHVGKEKPIVIFNHDLLPVEKLGIEKYNIKGWLYGHWHINYMKNQEGVMAVSTGTPDKGGIDHSTSAYRVLTADGKGNLSSDLRYSYIKDHIRIASVHAGEIPLLSNGSIPILVNVYSSVSPVRKVEYTLSGKNNRVIRKGVLTSLTDWTRGTEIPWKSKEENLSLTVKAIFWNGEEAVTEQSFRIAGNLPAASLQHDWTNLLGNPGHTGYYPEYALTDLKLKWVTNVRSNIYMSSPLIYNGSVFVAMVDENLKGEGGVVALNAITGDIRWRFTTRNSVKNSMAIEEGILFAQDAEGYLYALDTETGKLRWEKKLQVNTLPALIEGLVASKGVVYAGTGKGLAAFHVQTGEVVWTNTEWDQREGTTSTWTLGNDLLVAGAQWGGLFAHDSHTGELRWKNSEDGLSDRGASPALHGDLLYVTSRSSLFILHAGTGEVIVRKELADKVDVTSTPLLTGNHIVFGTSTAGLMALDKKTLQEKWQFRTNPALIYTAPYTRMPVATVEASPVGVKDRIYCGASDGVLYGLDTETGAVCWKHDAGAPLFASVAVSGNTLIAVDFGGNVYAFVSSAVK